MIDGEPKRGSISVDDGVGSAGVDYYIDTVAVRGGGDKVELQVETY